MNEQQPKILVIRLSSLGDIVLSSAVYKNLKAKWPKSHITLLVKPRFAQVLAGHPDIDEIMVAKKGLIANIRQVRAGHFTHLLDLIRSRISLQVLYCAADNKLLMRRHINELIRLKRPNKLIKILDKSICNENNLIKMKEVEI